MIRLAAAVGAARVAEALIVADMRAVRLEGGGGRQCGCRRGRGAAGGPLLRGSDVVVVRSGEVAESLRLDGVARALRRGPRIGVGGRCRAPAGLDAAAREAGDDVVLERLQAMATTADDVDGVTFGDLGLGRNIEAALAAQDD
mgnify:CR=1 FL=1